MKPVLNSMNAEICYDFELSVRDQINGNANRLVVWSKVWCVVGFGSMMPVRGKIERSVLTMLRAKLGSGFHINSSVNQRTNGITASLWMLRQDGFERHG